MSTLQGLIAMKIYCQLVLNFSNLFLNVGFDFDGNICNNLKVDILRHNKTSILSVQDKISLFLNFPVSV